MLHFILCLQALSNYHAHSVGNLEARTLWHADRVDWWMLLAWKEGIEMIDPSKSLWLICFQEFVSKIIFQSVSETPGQVMSCLEHFCFRELHEHEFYKQLSAILSMWLFQGPSDTTEGALIPHLFVCHYSEKGMRTAGYRKVYFCSSKKQWNYLLWDIWPFFSSTGKTQMEKK